MRLIKTENLEVVEVHDDSIPEYAILSHTWGDEEISFEEIRRLRTAELFPIPSTLGVVKIKAGLLKIQNSARLAREDGYKYIWIDTCCIDKTSSAELSEAINSMYRWYEGATICYAYLFDAENLQDESPLQKSSTFRRSKWFTRGWTLQELIASKDVCFLAKDWTCIGRKRAKDSFLQLLSYITGVDESVLDGSARLCEISVASRMKWASGRVTTRIEDLAYCLMGIFNVNMPLLYGEGEKAFIRLQEEILKSSNDQSLFAWKRPETANGNDLSSGLLAQSPTYYQDIRTLIPPPSFQTQESFPSSITNQGLHIQLYLRPLQNELFHAILDCSIWLEDEQRFPAIVLKRIWGDQFTRVDTATCLEMPPLSASDILPEEGYRRIYVKQNPVHFLPDFVIARDDSEIIHYPTLSQPGRGHRYRVYDIYPKVRWDGTKSILKSPAPSPSGLVAVLRFESPVDSSAKVDVVIGFLRQLHRWEPWCHKLRASDAPVESVYRSFLPLWQTAKWEDGSYNFSDHGKVCSDGLDHFLTTASVTEVQKQGRLYILLTVLSIPELSASEARAEEGEIMVNTLSNSKENIVQLTSLCSKPDAHLMHIFLYEAKTTRVRVHPRACKLEAVNPQLLQKKYSNAIDLWRELEGQGRSHLAAFSGLNDILDFNNFQPLHWAVAASHKAVIQELINNGADPGSLTALRWNFVHIACLFDNPESFKSILSHDAISKISTEAAVDSRCLDTFESPIHFAAAYASSNAAYFFDVLLKSAFQDQKENEDEAALSLILRHRNFLDETPLHRAAATGNLAALTALLRYPCVDVNDVDRFGRSILWHAACGGNEESIQILVMHGAQIDLADDYGRTPLHAACREGRVSSVEALLNAGANSNLGTHPPCLTPCHYTCLFGHSDCLQVLINNGADYKKAAGDSMNFQPIHLAAANGNVECLEYLITAGCDISAPCDSYITLGGDAANLIQLTGMLPETNAALAKILLAERAKLSVQNRSIEHSPLWIAAEYEHVKVAKVILSNSLISGEKLHKNLPELRHAMRKGRETVMLSLLATGHVDPNQTDDNGHTILFLSAAKGYIILVRALLKNNQVETNTKDELGRTPLWLAVQAGSIHITSILLDTGTVDVNCVDNKATTPLMVAVKRKRLEMVQCILAAQKVDVNLQDDQGRTGLWIAVEKGYNRIADEIFKVDGIDVNLTDKKKRTPLLMAVIDGNVAMVKLLLNAKEQGTKTRRLMRAASPQSEDSKTSDTALLVKPHAKVNLADEEGRTPLLIAVIDANTKIIRLLLSVRSVDPSVEDNQNRTPLSIAVESGQSDIVKRLVDTKKVYVNRKDEKGNTALLIATRKPHKEVVKILLDVEGIDANAEDEHGRTALRIAAMMGDKDLVEVLLASNKVDVEAADKEGQTPLSIAEAGGHKKVLDLLRKDLEEQEKLRRQLRAKRAR